MSALPALDINAPLPVPEFWRRMRVQPVQAMAALRLVSLGHARAAVSRVVGISAPTVKRIASAPEEQRAGLLAITGAHHWLAAVSELVGSVLFWSAPKGCWVIRFPVMAVVGDEIRFAVCSKCPACGHGIADTRDRQECRCCGTAFKSAPPDPVNRYLNTDRPTRKDFDLHLEVMAALRGLTTDGATKVCGLKGGNVMFGLSHWPAAQSAVLDDELEATRRRAVRKIRERRDRKRRMARESRRRNRR